MPIVMTRSQRITQKRWMPDLRVWDFRLSGNSVGGWRPDSGQAYEEAARAAVRRSGNLVREIWMSSCHSPVAQDRQILRSYLGLPVLLMDQKG